MTARLALRQNRKLLTLPHEIWNTHGIGTNKLLKSGAILVTSSEDILQECICPKKLKLLKNLEHIQTIDLSHMNTLNTSFTNCDPSITYSSIIQPYNSVDLKNTLSYNPLLSNKKPLKNKDFASIYELIQTEPISINTICKKTSKPIAEVSQALFSLELDGFIKKVAGGYICILNN